MTLAEMVCLVFHFICGIPPGGFIPITCTDSLSLMVLAWKDLRVYRSFNCCYLGSSSVWYFYIFPYFYRFLSWKTSIGGNVLCVYFMQVPSSRISLLPEHP